MEAVGELIVTGLMAFFLFVGLHYFPWRQITGNGKSAILNPPYSYICGVLGLGAIYSGLITNWWLVGKALTPLMVLSAFWVVIGCGGGAVLCCYALDSRLELRAKARDDEVRQRIEKRRQDEQGQ